MSDIENVGCGFYVKPNEKELLQSFLKIYDLGIKKGEEMGLNGKKYITENFDWRVKANELFKELEKL